MHSTDEVDLLLALRYWPARTSLFALGPVVLAVLQLLNAALNGFALWASVLFAAVMVAHAVLSARILLASLRLRTLEADVAE